MATIYNSDLAKELVQGAKLQQNKDRIPNELAEKVVPVMEVNPKLLRRAVVLASSIGKATTVSAATFLNAANQFPNKNIFITGIDFCNSQSAASDNTAAYLQIFVDGIQRTIPLLRKTTTTALEAYHKEIVFSDPLKMDMNTSITYTLAFTVGASVSDWIIYGYVDDVSLA